MTFNKFALMAGLKKQDLAFYHKTEMTFFMKSVTQENETTFGMFQDRRKGKRKNQAIKQITYARHADVPIGMLRHFIMPDLLTDIGQKLTKFHDRSNKIYTVCKIYYCF